MIIDKKMLIAGRMAIARKNSGLSQFQVAKIMGLHRPSISEIEAGRRSVSAEELVKFAKMYGVKVNWLACEGKEDTDLKGDEIELAARELRKLKKSDLNK